MSGQPEFSIGRRAIGPAHPPLVIPEIGINHNGDIGVALAMIEAAAKAGAEIVKFQSHVVEDEMSHHAGKVIPGNADISIFEIMASAALTADEERRLKDFCDEKGLIFLCTPFSRKAADRLATLDVAAFKIGSGECNNYPLVDHIASFGKPVILSTGMNTISSIAKSVDILDRRSVPFALLHCTNIYPTPPNLVRLGAMVEMQEAFPAAVIGLSDHTLNNATCLGAVALGACVLERHFTDTRERIGPDIVCSMTPDELAQLINWSREIHAARGGTKGPLPEEQATIDFAYASVVTTSPIEAGEAFSKENIWVKRPGTGELLAEHYSSLLGRRARRRIDADEQLRWDDVL
jgi:N-acetylneuraminate synthase